MENRELELEIKSSNHQPLKVEPENIYFDLLKQGKSGNAALKVTGGPGEVVIQNDRLKVTPTNFGNEDTEIQINLLAGSAGELIWDNIIFKGEASEIAVLVTARWEGFPTPEATSSKPVGINSTIEVTDHPSPIGTQDLVSWPRPWVGRRCSRCHKNFVYDASTHDWEQCHCNWYKLSVNMSKRITNDLRLGLREFPSYLEEIWRMVIGKEKL